MGSVDRLDPAYSTEKSVVGRGDEKNRGREEFARECARRLKLFESHTHTNEESKVLVGGGVENFPVSLIPTHYFSFKICWRKVLFHKKWADFLKIYANFVYVHQNYSYEGQKFSFIDGEKINDHAGMHSNLKKDLFDSFYSFLTNDASRRGRLLVRNIWEGFRQ